jgi:hypothetical protein
MLGVETGSSVAAAGPKPTLDCRIVVVDAPASTPGHCRIMECRGLDVVCDRRCIRFVDLRYEDP